MKGVRGWGNTMPGGDVTIRTSSRRTKMIFTVMTNRSRIEILRVLNTKGPITYSELKDSSGFKSKKDSGKFAYHLRKLHKFSLVGLNKTDRRYTITNMGKTVLTVFKQVEKSAVVESGKLYVRTSRGSIEEFDPQRVLRSLLTEGNLPRELAQKVTEEVESRIYKNRTAYLTSALIREMVNSVLLEYGLEDYRNRLVRVGLPVYDVKEMITNADEAGGDVEDLMLRAGQAVHAELLLTNGLSKEVTDMHLSGAVHIARPGLWSLLPDVIFLNMPDMVEGGIDVSNKRPDVSKLPGARNVDELLSLVSMLISLSHKEAAQEVVMDGLVSLLEAYANSPKLERKVAYALTTASTASRYKEPTLVSLLLQANGNSSVVRTILSSYKRYAEVTAEPKIGLIVDCSAAEISGISKELAAIALLGGRVTVARGQISSVGITNSIKRSVGMPAIYLGSVSVNLPRLALESSNDEMHFRTKLILLMNPTLEAMLSRRTHITDLVRRGLNPLLAKSTRYMQRGSFSVVLNLVGLREAVFGILGCDDKEGRVAIHSAISTAIEEAEKIGKKHGCDIRVCMVRNDDAARFALLDGEKYGKHRLSGVAKNGSYRTGVTVDASRVEEYSTKSEIISEANRLARDLDGGLLIDLEIEPESKPEIVGRAVEKASNLLSFFRIRIR